VNFGSGTSATSVEPLSSEGPRIPVYAEGELVGGGMTISSEWTSEADFILRRKSFVTRVAQKPNETRIIVTTAEATTNIV
jgi:hypothetical protein